MALADVYPLAFLSDLLEPSNCMFSLRRFDEHSGSGDGRFWTAQMAPPLWEVSLTLRPRPRGKAAEINAKLWALEGTRRAFLFEDRSYGPAAGQAAGNGVTVSSIGTDRVSVALTGLPASYRVTAGDRMSIAFGSGRQFMAVFAETVTANSSGTTGQIAISPALPFGVSAGAAVVMDRPRLKAIVPPGGYTPFTDYPGGISQGASITLLQKP
ncbi:hypothetical protein [Paracoccus kondratievae]|uniref:Uncharacterized protein n=1 Tax=Paracoccus kondratievae TaxID=135740 RepID=A0AAD3NWX0_9RHOB|nr:hypothetical protein [Paracoccus kondratievae]AZV00288.1 hypothetical protein pkon1_p59 [Paracoccus phage vB_PkoS_Pkon1]GLK63460.1 hypothetical protein GCM10017635_09300 [Paracoccus kondratievae]